MEQLALNVFEPDSLPSFRNSYFKFRGIGTVAALEAMASTCFGFKRSSINF